MAATSAHGPLLTMAATAAGGMIGTAGAVLPDPRPHPDRAAAAPAITIERFRLCRAVRPLAAGGVVHAAGVHRPDHAVRPQVPDPGCRQRRLSPPSPPSRSGSTTTCPGPSCWAGDGLRDLGRCTTFPTGTDLVWLVKGGGLFSKGVHPPAKKFNAGQKIIFWPVIVLGAVDLGLRSVAAVPVRAADCSPRPSPSSTTPGVPGLAGL